MRTLKEQLEDYLRSIKYFDDFDDNETIVFLILREILEKRKNEMTNKQLKQLKEGDKKLVEFYHKHKDDDVFKQEITTEVYLKNPIVSQIMVIESLAEKDIINL